MALRYAELVYDGKWFSALREALDAFFAEAHRNTTGTVRVRLHRGVAQATGRRSPKSLYREDFATFGADEVYRQSDAGGVHPPLRPSRAHPASLGGGLAGRGVMKLWGGRFAAPPADALDRLGKSIHFDRRLHAEEIRVNQAYARALTGAGVLDAGELDRMLAGLDRVAAVLASAPPPPLDDEDIHTAVERLLFDEIGELARKLPTGRSRNDLSQTEFRLYLTSAISSLVEGLDRLRTALLTRAEESADVLVRDTRISSAPSRSSSAICCCPTSGR